jgi:hypothetical protein
MTLKLAVTGKVSSPIQFQSYFTKFLLHSEKTQIHLVARKRRTKRRQFTPRSGKTPTLVYSCVGRLRGKRALFGANSSALDLACQVRRFQTKGAI